MNIVWFSYLIDSLKKLDETLTFLIITSLMVGLFLVIAIGSGIAEYEDSKKKALKALKISIVVFFIAVSMKIFLPSTRTMVLLGAYKVSEDLNLTKSAPEIIKKSVKLINKKLDDELKKLDQAD
jgi:hypothetical protein